MLNSFTLAAFMNTTWSHDPLCPCGYTSLGGFSSLRLLIQQSQYLHYPRTNNYQTLQRLQHTLVPTIQHIPIPATRQSFVYKLPITHNHHRSQAPQPRHQQNALLGRHRREPRHHWQAPEARPGQAKRKVLDVLQMRLSHVESGSHSMHQPPMRTPQVHGLQELGHHPAVDGGEVGFSRGGDVQLVDGRWSKGSLTRSNRTGTHRMDGHVAFQDIMPSGWFFPRKAVLLN